MNFFVFILYGLLLGFTFRFFPTFSLFLSIVPPLFFFLRRKYIPAIFSTLVIFLGIIYATISYDREQSDTRILNGFIISKEDNFYLFKTVKGRMLNLITHKSLESDKLYSVKCYFPERFKNPYSC